MTLSARRFLLGILIVLATGCSGGGGGGTTDTGQIPNTGNVPAPSITSFSVADASITAGESTTLTAAFADGTGAINNGVGAVTSGVPVTISPTVDTTYTLTVTNSVGSTVTSTKTVWVTAAPIVLAMGTSDLPYSTTLPVDGMGDYQITGLTPGHRYAIDLQTTNYPTIKYFSDQFVTEIRCDPNVWKTCSIIPSGSTIWLRIMGSAFYTTSVSIDGHHASAPNEFEGTWDAPLGLDVGAGSSPHVGKVDEYISYYDVQGLTIGTTYTFWVQSMSSDTRLGVIDTNWHQWVGGKCSPNNTYINDYWNPENCTWTATATNMLFAVENTDLPASASYILWVKEAVVSEGSAGSPATLSYTANRAAGTGKVALNGASYYKVTGLQAGANYSLSITNITSPMYPSSPLSLDLFDNDSTYTTTAACISEDTFPTTQCTLITTGTELYFKVVGPTLNGGANYDIILTPLASNEGTSGTPIALTPANLPYSGQVGIGSSYYAISGLTPNAYYKVFLTDVTGDVALSTYYDASGVLNCHVYTYGKTEPTCALTADSNGAFIVRPDNSGLGSFFTLNLAPAPQLQSTHQDLSGPTVVDSAAPTEIPIVVNGDPATSISNVTLELFIQHAANAELTAELIAPDGTVVTLFQTTNLNGTGGAAGLFNVGFNDYASERIEWGHSPYNGTYRPRTPLHVLNGKNANGTWTLRVTDNVAGQTGVYYAWGISFQ